MSVFAAIVVVSAALSVDALVDGVLGGDLLASRRDRRYRPLQVADVNLVLVELDGAGDEACDSGDVALGVAIRVTAGASSVKGVEDGARELSADARFAWH